MLENGRHDVRRFEDLIYGFYRRHSNRFFPICLFEAAYFIGGVVEVWYILSRLTGSCPSCDDRALYWNRSADWSS